MDINPYQSPQSKVEDPSKDLMRWFADAGERAERKVDSNGGEYLSKGEKLIYELWLLETVLQKGGVSLCTLPLEASNTGDIAWLQFRTLFQAS